MISQKIRINAALAYFFLGPLFLLISPRNPNYHDFIRHHAKKSTLNIIIWGAIFVLIFLLREFLYINILGFSVYNILLSSFFTLFFGLQMISAYKAFRGNTAENNNISEKIIDDTISSNGYSEEEKVQISLAFIPILSAFIAEKNPKKEILIGKKVSHFFLFLFIISLIFTNNSLDILNFLILFGYIILIASNAVWIFAKNSFLFLKIYNFIPTYHEAEAKIFAFFSMTKEFFQVAFGKEKSKNFQDEYQKILQKNSQKTQIETDFWTHPAIISLPIINIITIPSFFNKKFHEYQGNIAEWFFLTILCIFGFFFTKIYWLYLLIFPIIAIFIEAKKNGNIRAPITSIARNIFIFSYKTKQKIENLQKNTEESVISLVDNPSKKSTDNLDDITKNL